MKGLAYPEIKDESVVRSQEVLQLFEELVVADTVPRISDGVVCQAFRRFLVYIKVKGATTTPTIRYEVQFLEPWSGEWHTYKQGLFAALYYHDPTNVVDVQECFEGECMGREFRVKTTGASTTSVHYFTTSVAVEFRN